MLTADYRSKIFALIIVCLIMSLAWIESGSVAASSGKANAKLSEREFYPTTRAVAANRHSVHVGDMPVRANSGFHLLDGADIQTSYSGDVRAISALRSESIQSLSLATDDFNQDGAPDLIAGYSAGGRGVIAMYKGNIDAFAPGGPQVYDAIQSGRIPASFDAKVQALDIPERADFMVTGDFNHDGKKDILAGARGGSLYLMTGDGQGNFGAAASIPLPGQVTSLAAGELNKADGQPDVAVGITGESGNAVLVFNGAITGHPAKYSLSSAATSLAFATLDKDQYGDLAIAAGNEVVILHGQSAQTEQINVGFNIQSLTLGEFTWNREGKKSMALLGDDGAIHLLERNDLDLRPFAAGEAAERKINAIKNASQPTTPRAGITRATQSTTKGKVNVQWSLTTQLSSGNNAAAKQTLMSSQISTGEVSDLLVIDQTGNKINLLHTPVDQQNRANSTSADNSAVTMSVDGSPSAVLAMPKKVNGQRDLIVLRAGQISPSLMTATGQTTINVNRTDDTHASTCAGGANDCSLRGAIDFANAHPGTTVNLPAGMYDLTAASTFENSNANGDLDINASGTTIIGAGAGSTIIRQTATDRVFNVNFASSANFSFNLSGVTVQGGNDRSDLGGGAILLGGPSNDYSITNCTFDSNTATNAAGGAISLAFGGNLTLMSNTFINNGAGATRGGAISLGDGNVVAHFNRFVNNVAANAVYGNDVYASAGIGDFTNNWWANIGGPNTGDAVGKGGVLTTSPSLTLVLKTGKSSVAANSSTPITASFRNGTDGDPINTANLGALIGLPITFDAKAGTIGDSDVNIQGSATASASVTLANSDVATATVDGATASVTISAVPVSPPTLSIVFGAASIPVNGKTSLTFTITFPAFTYSNVSLTDNLPSGMVVANPANLQINGSCSPSVGATSGSNQVNVFIGTEVGSAVCTISLDVTPTTNGIKTNTTGAITSDESGAGGTATATLHVNAPPVLDLSFIQPSVRTTQPAGLTVTISNPGTNPDPLTNVSFTANLPTGVHVNSASQSPLCKAIGSGPETGTVTLTNPSTIALTGAAIAPNTSCQITIAIRTDARGQYTISGSVSSDNGGTGNTDSTNLTVSDAPTVTSSFSGPTVPLNGVTTLTLNITNPNTTSLSSIAFTDTLPPGLKVATPPNLTNNCGGTAIANAGAGTFSLTNGGLSPSASCKITVDIQGTTAGVKNNSVQVNSSEGGPSTSNASITVVSPPVIIKAFGAASIPLNGSTSLTFTIQNNNASTGITGVAFTDNLPAGLKVSTPNGLTGSCGTGTITATPVTGNVSLSGGTIAANSSCTFSINVTGVAVGTQNNTTSNVTSTEGGTGGTASASINVDAPPTLSIAFNPTSIPPGGTTVLNFTITNPAANPDTLNGISVTDTLPAGLTVPNATAPGVCGGTLTVTNPTSIALSGGTLIPGGQCQFAVTVTGTASGGYTNTTGNVASTNGGTGSAASANLTVVAPLIIAKSFSSPTMQQNNGAALKFTITNPDPNVDQTGIAFTDNFPADLFVGNPVNLGNHCGGTVTAVPGSSSVILSGGTLAHGGSCTIDVNVVNHSAGQEVLTNSVTVSSTEGGIGNTATISITVVPSPSLTKAFGAPSVPLNGSTSLTFTIQNNSPTIAQTLVQFGDFMPLGLVIATPNGVSGNCGGGTVTANPGNRTINLTNGTIPANGTCSFSLNVTGTTVGVKNNITGTVTSQEGGTGGTASASVNVDAPPTISKTFNPPSIALNSATSLGFTIGNPATNPDQLTGVGFTDTLPAGLTVSNASAPVCGGTLTVSAPNSIALAGATINPGAQCILSVTVSGTAAGLYTNTTGNVTSTNGGTGNTATATLTVGAPPTIVKSFGSGSIPLNGTTTLSFNIANPNAGLTLTGISFTDNMPAGLVVGPAPNVSSNCGGVVVATPGSSAVSLSGGTLTSNANCTVSVTVQGTTAGIKNNSVQVTSIEGGTGNTANASITVVAPPVIIKAFGAASIPLNGSTSLAFTIQNNNTTTTLHGVGFTDNLPGGLVVSTPNGITGSCGGGTITAVQNTGVVSLSGGSIAANSSCTFSVNVTGTTAGTKNNTTGNVTSTEGGTGGTASASVLVVAPPSISQMFSPPVIALNATTTLFFTIINPNFSTPLVGVAFNETLPAGLTVANSSATVCGGTLTLTAPSTITLSGGTISANDLCQFNVTVTGAAAGQYTPTTGNVTSTNGGTGNTAPSFLTVAAPPKIVKAFGAVTIPLNSITSVTFTINNPNTGYALTGIAFTDNLPAGLVVATPNAATNSCGGTVTAISGSGAISLSGGTLGASSSCTVSLNIQGTTPGVKTNSVMVTSNEGGNGNISATSMTVVGPPVIIKAFGAASIPLNGSTSLQFTIQNNNATLPLSGVVFTDTLPAGLLVATPNGLIGNCGAGLITAAPTSNSISLSGGTIPVNSSCTFSINVTGTTAGLKNNTTSNVTSTEGGTGGTASASVSVIAPPSISAVFFPTTIAVGGTSSLTFTITNPNTADLLIGVSFTDTLPNGLTVPNAVANACAGVVSLTLTAPNHIALSGENIAPNSQCVFSVPVTGAFSGQYTNTTGNVTSTNGGTGNTATANLTVAAPPTIVKAFGAASMPVNSSTALTFTITNPNSGLGLTGVGFTDNLPAGLVVATPNGLTGACGLGVITANAGSGTISLTGASIAASGVCSFSVNVTGTSVGVKNNTTGNITATESGTGGTASASITILSRTTTTSLSFSANPTVFGQTIQVTATVVDSAPAPKSSPTGTVSFASGAGTDQFNPVSCNLAPLGATTDTSTCTVNLTSTAIGTHSITGTYAGSAVHATSNGSSQLTVNKASSLTTLTADFNPGVVGQHINILAAVTAVAPGAGTPTGSVAFLVDGVPVGSDSVNNPGPAHINTEFLTGVGSHTIIANYSGDGGFIASSSSITLTINKASTTTTLTSSINPSSFGQSVTFTATVKAVAPSLGNPQGIVSFMDGNTLLGTGTVFAGNQGQSTTFTTANLAVGTHQLTAVFDGEPADYIGSSSPVLNQTVTKSPTTTALTSSANPSVFGQAVTFTATVTSIGPPVVNPGGTTRRTAVTRTVQTRTEATRAVTNAFGIGTPSGTVTFFDGATQIGTGTLNGSGIATFTTAALSAGVHSVTASYGGDASFQSSTSPALIQTVNKANTTSVLVSSANPSVFGQPVTITVTVTAASPGAGTPSGSVTILGLLPPGLFPISVPLNGSGVATQTFTNLAVGTYNVSANYSGDDNFNFGRSNLINQVVNKAATTTAITSSTPLAAVGGPVTYTATINPVAPGAGVPSGTVQFRDNGANIGGLVTLVAGQASVTESGLTFGLHTITAVYSGDGSFLASNGTLTGGQNVGLQFTDPVNGNKLIIDVVNSRYTFIAADGTVVANNVVVTLEFATAGTRVLRFTSANPIVAEVLIDETAPGTLQAKFYVPSTGKDFVMNITSGVKFTP